MTKLAYDHVTDAVTTYGARDLRRHRAYHGTHHDMASTQDRLPQTAEQPLPLPSLLPLVPTHRFLLYSSWVVLDQFCRHAHPWNAIYCALVWCHVPAGTFDLVPFAGCGMS